MDAQLNYGNWIRKKNLFRLGIALLGAAILMFLPLAPLFHIFAIILFVILLISFLFPFYAYWMFSQRGGKIQEKFYNLIIQSLNAEDGKFIDIGSGNGVLAVKLASHYPNAEVVGIDSWGEGWEYSKLVCQQNARAAKVDQRVHFQNGDAAALQFENETFEAAVSNLTFHEVTSVPDKQKIVSEALRVVKAGGHFAFIDYFYDPGYYGKFPDFESYLKSLDLAHFELRLIQNMIHIPLFLKHPKILGRVGILFGHKK